MSTEDITSIVGAYLSADDMAAIKQARGRQLAEQLYATSLIVPTTPEEADQVKAAVATLTAQLNALN